MTTQDSPLLRQFSQLEDPRIDRQKKHLLVDIVAIAVMACLCGIDSFEGMETFAEARLPWLRQFLALPNGVPSHDTINRVFARIKPDRFQACFIAWMKEVASLTSGEVVAFDGKTLRRSFDRASSKAAIHMVSAWASANGVCLGQVKTDKASNEITAIPKLLEVLCLKGCLVTIDAAGCQRAIAEKILEGQADYTLALKANQPTLLEDVAAHFDMSPPGLELRTHERSHGRYEVRQYYISDDINEIQKAHHWPGLGSIGMVKTCRLLNGELSNQTRYYLNSYRADIERFATAVRTHWQIESAPQAHRRRAS